MFGLWVTFDSKPADKSHNAIETKDQLPVFYELNMGRHGD